MTLRAKLVLALGAIGAVAALAAGLLAYEATASRLTTEIDRSLSNSADSTLKPNDGNRPPSRPAGGGTPVVQTIDGQGNVTSSPSGVVLPVDQTDREVAASPDPNVDAYRDITLEGGQHYRILTRSRGQGRGAVQAARPLDENDRILSALRQRIAGTVLLITCLSVALGWLLAQQLTRRLVRLTDVAEEVAATGDLEVDVPAGGRDEAARLGTAFDEMLAALRTSRDEQRRLVQDAGHELRTPLTSLRANIQTLRRYGAIDDATRDRLLEDLDSEARELTDLVDEVVAVAVDEHDREPLDDVALAGLAERLAHRTTRRTGRAVTVDADASVVHGRRGELGRAMANLLENAAKFDPGEEPIELTVRQGRVEVRDHGPGLDAADLPHVFDRFYRATAARSRPGSGLGLSIVREVATAHGGRVLAANHPDGGAVVGFEVPVVASAAHTDL